MIVGRAGRVEAVAAVVDADAVDLEAGRETTRRGRLLEHDDGAARRASVERRHQPGRPRAEDRDVDRGHGTGSVIHRLAVGGRRTSAPRSPPRPTPGRPGRARAPDPSRARTLVPVAVLDRDLDELVVPEVHDPAHDAAARARRATAGRSPAAARRRRARAALPASRAASRSAVTTSTPSDWPATRSASPTKLATKRRPGARRARRVRRPGAAGRPFMTAMRSARLSASSWSWVTKTAVASAAGQDRAHLGAHAGPERGIEVGERLVEQHERGLRRQRAPERDPLLLAAGELVRDSAPALSPSPTSSSISATRRRRRARSRGRRSRGCAAT